jgi:hypothetical protein
MAIVTKGLFLRVKLGFVYIKSVIEHLLSISRNSFHELSTGKILAIPYWLHGRFDLPRT